MSRFFRPRTHVASGRFPLGAFALVSSLLAVGFSPAHAGVALDVTPSFPATVTAAATGLPASFSFANSSTGPDSAF